MLQYLDGGSPLILEVIVKEWDRIKHNPSLRAGIFPKVYRCQNQACRRVSAEKLKVCSACKMVVYCSPECAKKGWSGWMGHKKQCSQFKEHAKILTEYKRVVDQFPWTDIGYDIHGVFNEAFVLAQFGLCGKGRQKFGYWAVYETEDERIAEDELLDAPWGKLTEVEGWRLPPQQIPSLELENSDNCPDFPPAFEDTWKSYFKWRRLPMASPAAMRLHWPMSVYACMKELGFVDLEIRERRRLTVFYVGARHDLAYLPVFGELALLFPNTDLDLVMFGKNVADSVKRANARGIAAAQSPRPCVFEYTSPASCGSGTIRIFFDSDPAYYCPSREPSEHPDAIVALNAGLASYKSWGHVVLRSFEFDIPFATTDYSKTCLLAVEQVWEVFHEALHSALSSPVDLNHAFCQRSCTQVVVQVDVQDVQKVCKAFGRERPSKFNEFMKPALRAGDGSNLLPGSPNAVVQVITPRNG